MVFYRKYRPQNLDELIGQEAIKDQLLSAHKSGKLAHAYLFCGPRGTGKTSTARILAKIVNCETGSPCNKCDSCLSITDGSNMDLIEIDAASNRGIEDIRTLRENIKLSPTKSKKKVYIIDEVHMLTTEAFNALLKTLEEPPSHVLFILATTDPQKIPQTILSRVQRLDFKPASLEDMKQALARIITEEKLEVEEGVLEEIGRRAQGSFRDGEKLLDQLSTLPKITLSDLYSTLSGSTFESLVEILEAVALRDSKTSLEKLNKLLSTGVIIKEVNLNLLEFLRFTLLLKNNLSQLVKVEVGDQKLPVLEKLATKFQTEHLIKTLDLFQQSLDKLRYVSIPSLPLEVAVVESSFERVKTEELKVITISGNNIEVPNISEKVVEETNLSPINEDLSSDIHKIQDRWEYVLETVRAYNFSLEALLRSSNIIKCDGAVLLFEVPYSFHQRMIEAPKSKDMLESIFGDILGRPVMISTILGKRPASMDDVANIEVAEDDEIVRIASEIFASDSVN